MKLFLLLMLVFVSCSPDTKVTDAERLFDTDYDSACIVIRSINPEKLISSRSKAIYALSLTRADFYNGTAHTNDSLISIATGFLIEKIFAEHPLHGFIKPGSMRLLKTMMSKYNHCSNRRIMH